MDVTCERCGTEYDFDETLVSERGTTVKCTNCGHLFKVFRAGAAATETDAGAPRAWAIRRRDGSTETLPTLRELQRRITEGALDEEDLISRSGEGWKRLGDIAELETFFHAARAAAAPQAAPRRRDHTDSDFGTAAPHSAPFGRAPSSPAPARAPRGIVGTREHEHPYPLPPAPGAGRPLSEPPRAAPPPRAPTTVGLGSTPPPPMHAAPGSGRKQTMMGVGAGYTAAPAPAAALPEPLPAPRVPGAALQPPHGRAIPPTAEYPVEEVERYKAAYEAEQARRAAAARIPEVAAVDPARRPASRSDDDARAFPRGAGRADSTDPTLRPAAAAASLPPGRLHVDDDDDDHAPRPARRGRARVVVGLALGLGVIGGGVALGWSTIGPALGLSAPADPAAPFLARGDEHLAGDAPASFGLAVTEYTKALAFRERDARVLAALSRAHAVWAQSLRFEAADLAARAPATPGAEAAAAALRPQQQAHTGDALRFAEDAVRQSPADADAEFALADAQRLAGDLRAARAHLDRARTLAPDASAEALRVGALLAAEEAGGSLGAARELASAAVTRDPALLRARLLFARALVASGDPAGARVQLDAALARAPRHEHAVALRDAIERGLPPAAAPAVAALAPVAAPADPSAPDGVAAPPSQAPTTPGGGTPTGGGGAPGGHDYGYYVEHGDRLQQSNRSADARRHFEAALALRPDGREALTGLGFIALAQGDVGAAMGYLRAPAAVGYGEAMIGMGEAYRKANRGPEALAAYREYLARFPSGAEASIARRWVDTLAAQHDRPAAAPAAEPAERTDDAARRDALPAPAGAETAPPSSDAPALQGE